MRQAKIRRKTRSISAILYGLDLAVDGNLYGLSSQGLLYQVNPANGATVLVGDSGNHFWLALAAAPPVSEPAMLLLFGTGLAVGGARYRRKR